VRRASGETGTGLIATFAALVVFVGFLLFAVQLLVDLYASTAASDAAFDGARLVAGSRTQHDDPATTAQAERTAEARVRSELGAFGRTVTFDWRGTDAESVQLRVRGHAPRFLWPGLQSALGVDEVDRTVRVRVESWR